MSTSWTTATHTDDPIDAAAVLALFAAEEWWPERTAREFQEVLDRGPAVAARAGGRVVGFARAVSDGAFRAHVEDVVVDREFRRTGIARELLDVLLDELPEGVTTSLFCHPELVPLYERAGFSATRQTVLHRAPGPTLTRTGPDVARGILLAYCDDIVSRFHGRPATPDEVERLMREAPNDDLSGDTGGLFVLRDGDQELGCGGVRFVDGRTAELTRVFVLPRARGRGLGTRIVRRLERFARDHGRTTVRLDTRTDLVEARRLYARLGYVEVAPFNDDPYAHHWFGKELPNRAG